MIPNYAFPEQGVTLRSIILRKAGKKEEEDELIPQTYEYVRPAQAAIAGFAPSNGVARRRAQSAATANGKARDRSRHCCACVKSSQPLPIGRAGPSTKPTTASSNFTRRTFSFWKDDKYATKAWFLDY